jgi:hypothetical protein
MAPEPPRPLPQRVQDTLDRLRSDDDAWVASADGEGTPYLIPLSFLWDGSAITLTTPETSRTARNLRSSGQARIGVGPTRDVVIIDGPVEVFTLETVPAELADAFAARLWDPRQQTERYEYFRITPQRVQAWREENELAGRVLMRGGQWLA